VKLNQQTMRNGSITEVSSLGGTARTAASGVEE
jgi:hypothetical protein